MHPVPSGEVKGVVPPSRSLDPVVVVNIVIVRSLVRVSRVVSRVRPRHGQSTQWSYGVEVWVDFWVRLSACGTTVVGPPGFTVGPHFLYGADLRPTVQWLVR